MMQHVLDSFTIPDVEMVLLNFKGRVTVSTTKCIIKIFFRESTKINLESMFMLSSQRTAVTFPYEHVAKPFSKSGTLRSTDLRVEN